jgi:hypothetical protein
MSITIGVSEFYKANGISALDFRCKHLSDCKRECENFVEAREAFIGRKYEEGSEGLPRLLFLSLDPGSEHGTPEERTVEVQRSIEENQCNVYTLPKNKHWFQTHDLAYQLLRQFRAELRLEEVHNYFAHTNSAKCCMNNTGNSQAHWRLFNNCREYLAGEVISLRPDLIVSQGDYARIAVRHAFPKSENVEERGCNLLEVPDRKVLWIHTYHPRNGRYFVQKRQWCPIWTNAVAEFFEGKLA